MKFSLRLDKHLLKCYTQAVWLGRLEISGIRNIRYLLISVLSYQSSIIEKMSELPVTNLHYFIRNKNPASYFLPDVRQVSFGRLDKYQLTIVTLS